MKINVELQGLEEVITLLEENRRLTDEEGKSFNNLVEIIFSRWIRAYQSE